MIEEKDREKVAYLVLKSASFEELLEQKFYLIPDFLRGTFQEEKIKGIAFEFVKTQEVQQYLLEKSQEMARFWARQVGRKGLSGDFLADALHASYEPSEIFSAQDVERFEAALTSSYFEAFRGGVIPFYATNYEPNEKLTEVLQKHNLSHLTEFLPWRTRRFFDWSDAPPLKLQGFYQESWY